MSGNSKQDVSPLRKMPRIRKSLSPELAGEFTEYKDIKSIDRIAVAAWIGFGLSLFLLPLDYSRMVSGELNSHDPYRYLFYLHVFGLIFIVPAYSMTFQKAWVNATRLRRGIHIWSMVVLNYVYLFGMGIVVFWDRDGLMVFMAFIFISSWMFAMSHKERILFILTTFPPMFFIIMLKPADQVSYDKLVMIYEISFLSIVAFVFDAFDYNLMVSNFLERKRNEAEVYENKVEAVMLQQFTSIHPAIHWRFREEAVRILEGSSAQQKAAPDIRFEDVFPFYGSLDMRNSSGQRQNAIAHDLRITLELALDVLNKCQDQLGFDILGELISETEKRRSSIQIPFSSGNESGIPDFIRNEINPVIHHMGLQYPSLASTTQHYQAMCGETGICTRYRMRYEEALTVIHDHLLHFLEAEEKDLQRLYPCYFEKYLTDGLEYNIFAGPSIAKGHLLDPLYLDNIRLRQLLWTRQMILRVEELQPQIQPLLNVSMDPSGNETGIQQEQQRIEIAPLILAYMTPITLTFRPDEKKLDVHGSYSVRYQMLKKRIDKAVISGREERLTQPGCISVVYSREQERDVYEKHLLYMQKKNLVREEWSRFDLEPLPGADGLKALRVRIL